MMINRVPITKLIVQLILILTILKMSEYGLKTKKHCDDPWDIDFKMIEKSVSNYEDRL